MKLNAEQAEAVKQSLSVEPLDEENPAMDSLRDAFGDHTFYVVSEGLFVLEPVNDSELEGEPAEFIQVAAWTDEQKNALRPVQPQKTNTVVDLANPGEVSGAETADGEDSSA